MILAFTDEHVALPLDTARDKTGSKVVAYRLGVWSLAKGGKGEEGGVELLPRSEEARAATSSARSKGVPSVRGVRRITHNRKRKGGS
jgi:hypothetical protein